MKWIFTLFIFLIFNDLSGQYYTNQNKVWAFGLGTGLDFNSGRPVSITTSMNIGMGEPEGCASVCDSSGHLLFYSNGMKVYNKTGAVMPTGSSIVSFNTISTEQAALIIPVIGKSSQYYLFSLASVGQGNLAYSIVDMTLAGGLGDVIATTLGTPLQDTLGENMIAITGNNNNIWLVTHKEDTPLFLAFNITSSGISAPVVSEAGIFHGSQCYAWSMLRESPDRRKIAQGVYESGQFYGTLLYDFDPNTGIVSNCKEIDTANTNVYGIEFSPDNSKLYSNGNHCIIQYNISLPTIAAIQASKFVVTDSSLGADLRLGPNGIIYFKGWRTNDLHCISSPNLSGAACSYISHAVTMPSSSYETFPNLFVNTDTVNRVYINDLTFQTFITIYPNPTTTELTITSTNKISQITIANPLGQPVYTHEYNTEKAAVNVSSLPTGIYFIKINSTEVRKFVKQ